MNPKTLWWSQMSHHYVLEKSQKVVFQRFRAEAVSGAKISCALRQFHSICCLWKQPKKAHLDGIRMNSDVEDRQKIVKSASTRWCPHTYWSLPTSSHLQRCATCVCNLSRTALMLIRALVCARDQSPAATTILCDIALSPCELFQFDL